MTDHPLTETAAVELWGKYPRLKYLDDWTPSARADLLAALRAAFDAGREHERTNPDDARPWEPLNEGDPLHVGDEVRQDYSGVTRTAVVGRVGEDGTPWTTERDLIGLLHWGTWYVRRLQDITLDTWKVDDQ